MTASLFRNMGMTLLNERERWVLWLPLAVGTGIAGYFALPIEPPRWLGPMALVFCLMLGIGLRRFLVGWIIALALGLAAFGFTLAAERSAWVAAPVLQHPTGMISFQGRIAEVEPLEQGLRVVVDRIIDPRGRIGENLPEKVRIRMPPQVTDLWAGQVIAVRASLLTPPMPAAPGSYDFARVAWFRQIGAVGYAVVPPEILDQPPREGWPETVRLWIANRRHDLTNRIVSAIDGAGIEPGVGATAAALITAERGPVPPDLLQAYRDAGLAHILVIAGMHMSMVAGLVFVAIRGLLAAIPYVALRYPIKKWTAAAALLITLGYLIISGAPVPTQRAFIMNGIVLIAVLLDREAISLRSITWAALAVMVMEPEALTSASFQMSFAAVYGLIAGYEALAPRLALWRQRSHGIFGEIILHFSGILLTTLIASSATTLYTLFHFNRFATYSLLGNAAAVPVVGFWVMPSALLAFLLMPFGLDGWGWQLMGWGIVVVNHIALWVSSLPGAAVNLPSMPQSALIVFTLGGLWLLLWQTRWRLWGLAGMAAGLVLFALHQPPDLLVDGSGKVVAARFDSRLVFNQRRNGQRLRETWAQQAGQGDDAPLWADTPAFPVRCDDLGCVLSLRSHAVALPQHPEALIDDCQAADLVISPQSLQASCPSARRLIDIRDLRARGTHQIWLEPDGVRVLSSADWQGDRPWARHPLAKHRDEGEDEGDGL